MSWCNSSSLTDIEKDGVDSEGNVEVFFDISIGGSPAGRIVFKVC